jgi:Asp/Glu/hydantoin racemase
MALTIYFIHTITGLEKTFDTLTDQYIGREAQSHHISDESLIRRILANKGLTKDVRRHFLENIIAAEDAGADIVQVTCSSVTPVIPCARELVNVPVFSIDEPMAEKAVDKYNRIGVMATNPGTLDPSSDLIRSTAEQRGKEVTVQPLLCEGAYEALLAGEPEEHDRIVRGYFRTLANEIDVIILAQASMARIIETLSSEEKSVPVLTSPPLAMEHLAEYVRNTYGPGPRT